MTDTGRIVVIGDVIDDVLVTPSGPVRRDTDTPSRIETTQGGSGANVAAWLGHLGASVDFYGRVGRGDAPRHSLALEAFGVRTRIDEHPSLPTGRIVILIEDDHRTFLTDGGASRSLAVDVLTDERIRGAAAVHLTGHSMLEPWRLARTRDLIARAHALDVPVVLDPSSSGFLADIGPTAFLDAVTGVDVLLPNLHEGAVLTGRDDPRAIAQRLTDAAATVVLTLGAEGAIVARRGLDAVRVPAASAVLVDPTGAGDAFAAGFHAARARGADDVTATQEAVVVAARAVARPGGRPTAGRTADPPA